MDPETAAVIQEIDGARELGRIISAERVSLWIGSASRDVNALAFAVLFDYPALCEALPPDQMNPFFRRHLLQAFRDDRPTANVPSRYMAADTLRAWFQRLWAHDPADPMLARLRDDFASLVNEPDGSLRNATITGLLEHLFVRGDIREFFSIWTAAPELREAYQEAVQLAST